MPDHAISADPDVQRQLNRLTSLSPGADILGLERIAKLLDRLGRPQRSLPPTFHVAGTNGKGSTCAFLRAALEASGHSVHVYTSPHLVRFNERIRIAGRLIDDALLASLLEEVLDARSDVGASFFEVTTAAAFLAFARTPADACVIEVGLGGRLDATNIIEAPVACGIAQLGIDHQAFLGDTIEQIAAEKAGIAKRGVPLLTQAYPAALADIIERVSADAGAAWLPNGASWDWAVRDRQLHYSDRQGALILPLPRLPGPHQAGNAALAFAMLRHQEAVPVAPTALRAALGWAEWPARLQHLTHGTIADGIPAGSELWLDGGHNPAAAGAIADFLDQRRGRIALVLGLLANKDPDGILAPLLPHIETLIVVPVPGHDHHDPAALARRARQLGLTATIADDVPEALDRIIHAGAPPTILVMGSLYLAGRVLADNGTPPD